MANITFEKRFVGMIKANMLPQIGIIGKSILTLRTLNFFFKQEMQLFEMILKRILFGKTIPASFKRTVKAII
uniref:Uncharacterized protein n=1 Tax=Acrobeloides nanus TaxID=290746 RepID=A0A914CWP8_9BILA